MIRRNVLIFHPGALGDFVLSWPLALAAGRMFPQSRIIYVTARSKGKLAEKALRVESADIEAGWHLLFVENAPLPEGCRKMLDAAHTIIAFNGAEDKLKSAAPEARVIGLQARPAEGAEIHAIDFLIEQLSGHTALQEGVKQIVKLIRQRGLISPWPEAKIDVLIHPGSGSRGKCWGLEKFTELAGLLQKTGRSVRFVIGEVELERWSEADRQLLSRGAPVTQPGDYLALMDEITQAKIFVGNDSGPGHLAAALGASTISLFGETNHKIWAPIGPRVHVIEKMSEIDPLKIERAFAAALG
jgi:ADP-heptose:LPS heptosyltransferase